MVRGMVRKFLLVALLVVVVLGVTHAFADGTTCVPQATHPCNEGPQGNASCSDGIDNDQDNAIDNLDPDCKEDASQGPNAATCHDGLDNDRDGLIDGADPDCQTPPTTEGPPGDATCSDGVDNDHDGLIDGADPDCQTPEGPPGNPTCSDGIDNDGDGLIDAADPGCVPPDPCTAAAGDPGLLTDDTLGQTLWDSGLMIPPLTEDPDRDGAITGPLGDAFQPPDGPLAALEPLGDEATCAGDLALDQDALPDL